MLRYLSVKVTMLAVFFLTHHFVLANKKITQSYIEQYKNIAISEMKRTGIPASIKLAQGLLESDLGRSPLAYEANNHFGIKCGKDWSGKTYQKLDDDTDSIGTVIHSCFRVFTSGEESYIAHSEFLTNPAKKSRYGFLFHLSTTDYVGWANGLKFSGYASDPEYASKIIKIIEANKLHTFDEEISINEAMVHQSPKPDVPSKSPIQQKEIKREATLMTQSSVTPKSDKYPVKHRIYKVEKINEVKKVTAFGGEKLQTLAYNQGVDVYDLLMYNEGLSGPETTLEVGEIIYLEKKKKNYYDVRNAIHTVQSNETMYSISQKYGVRLENLLAKNNIPANGMPLEGQKISLVANLSIKDSPKYKIIEKFDSFVDLGSYK